MPIQIANPVVVDKVNRMAQQTGLTKTAVIDHALDVLQASKLEVAEPASFDALFRQMDRIPDLPVSVNPLEWDEQGLPK
jgi:antitoxin VapB